MAGRTRSTRETGGSNTGTSSNFARAYRMQQDKLAELQRRIAESKQQQQMVNPLTRYTPVNQYADPLTRNTPTSLPTRYVDPVPRQRITPLNQYVEPVPITPISPSLNYKPAPTNSWDYENLPPTSYYPPPPAPVYTPPAPTNSWDYENLPPSSYHPPTGGGGGGSGMFGAAATTQLGPLTPEQDTVGHLSPNQIADMRNALRLASEHPPTPPQFQGPSPNRGGGAPSSGGGGGGGYSSGGGGGGGGRALMPVAPPSRVQMAGPNTSRGGPRLKSPNNWSVNPNTGQVTLNGVVTAPPPGSGGTLTSPVTPPVVPPVVIDPGTGLPVTPPVVVDPGTGLPPVVPPVTVEPGYQVPANPIFAAGVPDPVFQQYLASQGQFGAASVGTPYIPTVNQPFASPLSAAGVPTAPTYTGPVPPALNQGGLAGNYSEVGSDMFAEQPELLLRDMLNQQYGQGKAGGLYNMLEPYSDNMNALYLGQAGQNAASGNKADFTNWLSKQWGNMQRPGTYTNSDTAIRNVLNPSTSSPLYAYVTEGDPQEQYRNTANLLGSAISMGYHPLFAAAMMNRLKQAGLDYQGQAARGGAAMDPFYKYLQTSSGIPSLSQLVGA